MWQSNRGEKILSVNCRKMLCCTDSTVKILLVILAFVATACRAPQESAAASPAIVLVPTFTVTVLVTATLPALTSPPVTATLALLPPPDVLDEAPLKNTPPPIPELDIGNGADVPATALPTAIATVDTVPTIPAVVLTPAPSSNLAPALYIVVAGDTLFTIAERYNTTVTAIQAANRLTSDLIQIDQPLLIPVTPSNQTAPPLPVLNNPIITNGVVTAVATLTPPLPVAVAVDGVQSLSVLEGDLASAYPESLSSDHFTLHFAPGTVPATHVDFLTAAITRALAHHEQKMQVTFPHHFDAYAAGSPFRPPDQSLRGHSYSADRYFVFLDDGSGNAADLTYLVAHELTHMFTWQVFGRPTDPMLSEGAAVYLGMEFIAGANHMPITTFCAAYQQAGVLPYVSQKLTYLGHLRDLENYYAAGCFIKYLIEMYGPQDFGRLYPSNDYAGIYGKTLAQLDEEWHAAVATADTPVPFDAAQLVQAVEALKAAYANLFAGFSGTAQEMQAYRALDQVRMALLEGRLDSVRAYFNP